MNKTLFKPNNLPACAHFRKFQSSQSQTCRNSSVFSLIEQEIHLDRTNYCVGPTKNVAGDLKYLAGEMIFCAV